MFPFSRKQILKTWGEKNGKNRKKHENQNRNRKTKSKKTKNRRENRKNKNETVNAIFTNHYQEPSGAHLDLRHRRGKITDIHLELAVQRRRGNGARAGRYLQHSASLVPPTPVGQGRYQLPHGDHVRGELGADHGRQELHRQVVLAAPPGCFIFVFIFVFLWPGVADEGRGGGGGGYSCYAWP